MKRLKKAALASAALLILANEIRGIIVVLTVAPPIFKAMF